MSKATELLKQLSAIENAIKLSLPETKQFKNVLAADDDKKLKFLNNKLFKNSAALEELLEKTQKSYPDVWHHIQPIIQLLKSEKQKTIESMLTSLKEKSGDEAKKLKEYLTSFDTTEPNIKIVPTEVWAKNIQNFDAEHFDSKLYHQLLHYAVLLFTYDSNGNAMVQAYNLATLFGDRAQAIKYAAELFPKTYPKREHSFHNACDFALHSKDITLKVWQQIAKNKCNNPRFWSLLAHADKIEQMIRADRQQNKTPRIKNFKAIEKEIAKVNTKYRPLKRADKLTDKQKKTKTSINQTTQRTISKTGRRLWRITVYRKRVLRSVTCLSFSL